jgi:hypothetical protein
MSKLPPLTIPFRLIACCRERLGGEKGKGKTDRADARVGNALEWNQAVFGEDTEDMCLR